MSAEPLPPDYSDYAPELYPRASLREVHFVLLKHRWPVIAVILATWLFAFIAKYTETPAYRATALIQIDWGRINVVPDVMINPTRAGSLTIETGSRNKMIELSKTWTHDGQHYGGYRVVNVFGLATDNESEMDGVPLDECEGPLNWKFVSAALREATGDVVFAWGNQTPKRAPRLVERICLEVQRLGVQPKCLKLTAEGNPHYPSFRIKPPNPLVPFPL